MSKCILWFGRMTKDGYGRIWGQMAHRRSYSKNVGKIPTGFEIDHLCRNRACINPEHLELVTRLENSKRAVEARKFCKRGHPTTEENTYFSNGIKRCRICIFERQKGKRVKIMKADIEYGRD